jgi:ATP-dependent helicase/nuclease subunit B
MASIARTSIEISGAGPWPAVTRQAIAWAVEHGVALRDAVVLLPFVQLLSPARREWSRAGGWMPRIETTQTLARSLGPPGPAQPGQVTFDVPLDRLAARALLLRSQTWAVAWMRRDPRAFEHGVAALVQTAHDLARAAAAVDPRSRAGWWAEARALLQGQAGPGATERALVRVALEWAAASESHPTDALFDLTPSAWIVVQAGGAQPLCESLMRTAPPGLPCLLLDTDVSLDDPFAMRPGQGSVSVAVSSDFEAEAQRTAAHVLDELARQADAPQAIALVAQDRVLTRRVRALLARRGVALVDETGWKLSTTRAGATLASLLGAARHSAGSDDWLDWLKACARHWPSVVAAPLAVQHLESALRSHGWVAPQRVDAAALGDLASALWTSAAGIVAALRSLQPCGLPRWLEALRSALQACGAWSAFENDDAGRQVLAALHLRADAGDPALAGHVEPLGLDDFIRWTDAVLEEGSFRPQALAAAQVIVTPLERTLLRPFDAVILAGADEKRLGGATASRGLIGDALSAELGLQTSASRRDAQTLAFAQLLRAPRLILSRRLDDAGEPLAASPLLERLALSLERAGGELADAADPREQAGVSPAPVPRPRPVAGALLPVRISASACEALRSCPYRFFALRMLRLREAEELEDEIEKRDYGEWLHAVLYRFHATRERPLGAQAEAARLHATALEIQQELHLDAAAFLPFSATFARFVPRYVQWLHERDRRGIGWLHGELELTARPPQWGGIEMFGVLDRIDSVPGGAGPVAQLIDYKTGGGDALREQMKEPLEDTQLAFYAALMLQQPNATGRIAAAYLPLDDSGDLREIGHPDVERSAQRLLDGVGVELAQVRAGAPLPALGEGRVCSFCEARGLCRRDHWMADEVSQ